jgi:hypothetical protein
MTFLNITYENITLPNIKIIGFPNIFNVATYILAIIGLYTIIKYVWEHTYVHARSGQ